MEYYQKYKDLYFKNTYDERRFWGLFIMENIVSLFPRLRGICAALLASLLVLAAATPAAAQVTFGSTTTPLPAPPGYKPVAPAGCTKVSQPISLDLGTSTVPGADPHWLARGPAPGSPVLQAYNAPLGLGEPITGSWVQSLQSSAAGNNANGFYSFTIWFNLPCPMQNLVLKGGFASNDQSAVYLNGSQIANCNSGACPGTITNYTVSSGFVTGMNSLTVVVVNVAGYTGMAMKATLTGACKEVCEKPQGLLKICKVAGPGVKVGTVFDFDANGTFHVPAGPGPGGTCVLGPNVPVGTNVKVTETIPPGYLVSDITTAPTGALVMRDLPHGTSIVTVGPGVTEVTYTDYRNKGYLEICKQGDVRGDFTFFVKPDNLGPFTVAAGTCSPAIETTAGTVVIQEAQTPGAVLWDCRTIPASQQLQCDKAHQTSTVIVSPGDIPDQTVAIIQNRPVHTGQGDQSAPSQ